MASNIATLVKSLDDKYRELSDKEADYLSASETRCGPPQESCFDMFTSNYMFIYNFCWTCQFAGRQEARDHETFRGMHQSRCHLEQLHHAQQEPFLNYINNWPMHAIRTASNSHELFGTFSLVYIELCKNTVSIIIYLLTKSIIYMIYII